MEKPNNIFKRIWVNNALRLYLQERTYELSTQLQVDISYTFIQNSTIFNDT